MRYAPGQKPPQIFHPDDICSRSLLQPRMFQAPGLFSRMFKHRHYFNHNFIQSLKTLWPRLYSRQFLKNIGSWYVWLELETADNVIGFVMDTINLSEFISKANVKTKYSVHDEMYDSIVLPCRVDQSWVELIRIVLPRRVDPVIGSFPQKPGYEVLCLRWHRVKLLVVKVVLCPVYLYLYFCCEIPCDSFSV